MHIKPDHLLQNINNTQNSTSTTDGALVVKGGIGIEAGTLLRIPSNVSKIISDYKRINTTNVSSGGTSSGGGSGGGGSAGGGGGY